MVRPVVMGVVVVFSPTFVMELPFTTHRSDDAEHKDSQTTHEQNAAHCVSGQLGTPADPQCQDEDNQTYHGRYDYSTSDRRGQQYP